MANDATWWTAPKFKAHEQTVQYVTRAEQDLGDVFERHFRLECLYDPNNPDADGRQQDRVTENIIAANVDTVVSVISTAEIRARYMTDGADWKQQRTARRLEWYTEDLSARYDVLPKCRKAFKESVKKGNGLVKVHAVFDEPRVEQIPIENVVVPADECRDGRAPRQMHQWEYIDADELAARFPDHEADIERVRKTGRRSRQHYTSTMISHDVECLWSYRLPVGKKDAKGYKPGRETLVIDGATLIDRKWERDYFPFGMMAWSERANSFYAISAAERIMGIQRALNKNNWVIEKGNDNVVSPPIYVRPADANIGAKTNRVNGYTMYRADLPQTVQHQSVSNETYNRNQALKEAAQQEFGQTSMATHGAKPPGLDSGVAMREFKDQTTQRFASQEDAFEHLVLWCNYLLIDVCKDLGAKAPKVERTSRFGSRVLAWKDVDMKDVRVQIKAAANLNRTPAGRTQLVLEFAQAGIISQESARRLTQHPDMEAEMSLYTAALESIEMDLDEIADGRTVMPEPFTNVEMAVWRGQREYLKWRSDGAPERILEKLRQYVVQAAWMQSQAQAPAANANAPMVDPAMAGPADMAAPQLAVDPTMAPTSALAGGQSQLLAS